MIEGREEGMERRRTIEGEGILMDVEGIDGRGGD